MDFQTVVVLVSMALPVRGCFAPPLISLDRGSKNGPEYQCFYMRSLVKDGCDFADIVEVGVMAKGFGRVYPAALVCLSLASYLLVSVSAPVVAQTPVQDADQRVRWERYQQQYNAASAEYQRQYDVVWREYQKAIADASKEHQRQVDEAGGERQRQLNDASRGYFELQNAVSSPRPVNPEGWADYQQRLNEAQRAYDRQYDEANREFQRKDVEANAENQRKLDEDLRRFKTRSEQVEAERSHRSQDAEAALRLSPATPLAEGSSSQTAAVAEVEPGGGILVLKQFLFGIYDVIDHMTTATFLGLYDMLGDISLVGGQIGENTIDLKTSSIAHEVISNSLNDLRTAPLSKVIDDTWDVIKVSTYAPISRPWVKKQILDAAQSQSIPICCRDE